MPASYFSLKSKDYKQKLEELRLGKDRQLSTALPPSGMADKMGGQDVKFSIGGLILLFCKARRAKEATEDPGTCDKTCLGLRGGVSGKMVKMESRILMIEERQMIISKN